MDLIRNVYSTYRNWSVRWKIWKADASFNPECWLFIPLIYPRPWNIFFECYNVKDSYQHLYINFKRWGTGSNHFFCLELRLISIERKFKKNAWDSRSLSLDYSLACWVKFNWAQIESSTFDLTSAKFSSFCFNISYFVQN